MVRLKTLVARLHRAIPDSHKHMTVYGSQEFTTFICKVCGKTGYLGEAYLSSSTSRKHGSHIRPYHASCWNETNGRTKRKSKEETATLFDFIMD